METLLKKPEVVRDENGRFDRHGKSLAKTQKKVKPAALQANNSREKTGQFRPGHSGNPEGRFKPGQSGNPAGRPKGVPNKVTTSLKDMILNALNKAGGEDYLARLAIENSSAFSSLVGKVLPTTLAADQSSGGVPVKMVFERHIVFPDGRREIQGVTPKSLPPPDSSHAPTDDTNEGAA
jgi:Family of unknown function (DUF5681)